MELNGTNKNAKKRIDYNCEKCAFITCNKTDYARHIKTIKHLGNEMELKKTQKRKKPKNAKNASTFSSNCNLVSALPS